MKRKIILILTAVIGFILALGIAFVPSFARIVRSEFIKYKNMDYVKNARLQGASDFRIMFVHFLPNTVTVLLSAIMIGFNNAVLAEAGMSFLGIGVQPPDASLGRMLSEAQAYLFRAPAYAIFPGVVIPVAGSSVASSAASSWSFSPAFNIWQDK